MEISAYYLYLTTQISNDSVGQKKVAEELSRTYMKHPDSWPVLCMLVNVDQEYRIYTERLRALEEQYYRGAHSICFYLEAFRCYRERTSSLKRLGEFEIHVLLFAAKYGLMTKELALYTSNLASQMKGFDGHLFTILTRAYRMYEESMILSAICTLLIKGSCTQSRYFPWFERAVEEELKLAQLYEYYMESLDPDHFHKPLPRSVYLYFMHGNMLDVHKKALLYANLITYEDETTEIYAHYRDEMEAFAWSQLEQHNIDDRLRIIYKRFITEDSLNPERVRALYDICHAYQVTTHVRDMKFVLVISAEGEVTQRVPYLHQGAKVFLYDKRDRIVWESGAERHFADSVPYESKRLFYELRYMDICRKYLADLFAPKEEEPEEELTLDLVRRRGPERFPEEEILGLCSRTIREMNYAADDFLTYLCHGLFVRGQFDRVILTYLAKYYCGSTREMKALWEEARGYEVHTHELSERILTQMLYGEQLFGEVAVFESYYAEGAYFRLQQAYLVYMSHEYVVADRKVHRSIIDIIIREYEKGEEIPDVCKIAVLKYYAGKAYAEGARRTLRKFLQELCGRQIYFPFYLEYEKEWLMELQLWDKTMICYRGQPDSLVILYYHLQAEGQETQEFASEVLLPTYDNIYVKKFVLYAGEQLQYYFKETIGGSSFRTEKRTLVRRDADEETGRYGRLNHILEASGTEREARMQAYAQEDRLSEFFFQQYQTRRL